MQIIDSLPWRAQLHLLGYYAEPLLSPEPDQMTQVPVGGGEIVTFKLAGDERVSDGSTRKGKWASRKSHPWIKIVPVKKGVWGIGLTSEGSRRLAMLKDCAQAEPFQIATPKA